MMPKEGHFAKSSRTRHLNNFRVRQHQTGRLITTDQFEDYVLTRFMLTTKRDLPDQIQESNQRFLIELLPILLQKKGNISSSVRAVLPSIAARAPWQFYWQVQEGWNQLQHFLLREIKAVPIKPQIFANDEMSMTDLAGLISQILANQLATLTTLSMPTKLRPDHTKLSQQLRTALIDGPTINWERVRSLMKPYPFEFDNSQVDGATADWLQTLAAL